MTQQQKSILLNLRLALGHLRTVVTMSEVDMSIIMIDELLRPTESELSIISDKQAGLLNAVIS
jgi:hypothetical protein